MMQTHFSTWNILSESFLYVEALKPIGLEMEFVFCLNGAFTLIALISITLWTQPYIYSDSTNQYYIVDTTVRLLW